MLLAGSGRSVLPQHALLHLLLYFPMDAALLLPVQLHLLPLFDLVSEYVRMRTDWTRGRHTAHEMACHDE